MIIMFGHDSLNYGNIHTLLHNAETRTFNATEFDIPNTTSNNNLSVAVKWVEATETYHFKGMPFNYYQDTGTKQAGLVKKSTVGQYGGVKARLDAGQGLIFESLSPNDSPTAPDLTGENPNLGGGTPPNGNGEPVDCASENREDGDTEDECGDCLSGYEEDDTGTCVAVAEDEEEDNTMRNLAIGGVIVATAFFYLKK